MAVVAGSVLGIVFIKKVKFIVVGAANVLLMLLDNNGKSIMNDSNGFTSQIKRKAFRKKDQDYSEDVIEALWNE